MTTLMTRLLAAGVLLLAGCGNDRATPRDASVDVAVDAAEAAELPCAVRAIVAEACAHCHAAPPAAEAPMPLLSRLDFLQPSSVDGEHLGDRSAARLRDPMSPMPPRTEPPLADRHVEVLEAWIAAGMPAGECEPLPAKPLATTCASGVFWANGDNGDEDMNPGLACNSCHENEANQQLRFFAGTVFGAFHEQDLCTSEPPPGAVIEILDADGVVQLTLTPSESGNFRSASAVAGVPLPYRARLVANGLAREMASPQLSGDCNSCHTEQGTHHDLTQPPAPGRLVWPRPSLLP